MTTAIKDMMKQRHVCEPALPCSPANCKHSFERAAAQIEHCGRFVSIDAKHAMFYRTSSTP
jgi:hypothetical protein